MRTKKLLITERTLMYVIAGTLFEMAPNRKPRKAEELLGVIADKLRLLMNNDNEWYTIYLSEGEVRKFIRDLLMPIPLFQELNLSQREFDNGVKPDDPKRGSFMATSRYDVYDENSWKYDFIDLDAFTGNVGAAVLKTVLNDKDCFMCKYDGENSDVCNVCKFNTNLKDMQEYDQQLGKEYFND